MKTRLCFILSATALTAVAGNKPNIIYIYADDMGKGMISAYGQKQFTTPNIDRLIQQGTSFTNAYGCMLSAPARASLLTGYHDCHGGRYWYLSGGAQYLVDVKDTVNISAHEKELDEKDVFLEENDLYLPQVFQEAGYTTAQIGKLEWGFTATRKQMRKHGWDYYYGYLDHVRCHGFYPNFLFDNGRIDVIPGNTLKNGGKSIEQETEATLMERRDRRGKEVYSQDIFLDKMLGFIRENKDKPFFLYHPTQLPHGPVAIPSIDPEIAKNQALTTIEKEYASMVKKLDETVGIIMGELKELGIDKNTIIVFAADNGHELYYSQKGRCEKPYRNMVTGELFNDLDDKYYSSLSGDVFDGNAGMAGLKRSNLQGGICIPMVYYCPGLIPEGRKTDALISNYDFLPTMADFVKVPLKMEKDGHSYLDVLLKKTHVSDDKYVVTGSNTGPAIIMNDGWKLRHYLGKKTSELFYLPDDPQERHDLSSQYPEKVKQLKELLLKECDGDLNNGVNRAG